MTAATYPRRVQVYSVDRPGSSRYSVIAVPCVSQREYDRLRKALVEIANPTDVVYGYANTLVETAREALK